MAMNFSVNHQFRPGDVSHLRGPDAEAYGRAVKLKAEVEAARESAPKEVFEVNKPEELGQVPGLNNWVNAKQTLSSLTRTGGRDVQNFFQHDGVGGQQFKLASSMAAGMIGGLGGSFYLFEGDLFSKTVNHDDGSKSVQNLLVDKSGLMNYSEWEIPSFPGASPPPSASSNSQPVEFGVIDTATGVYTPGDNEMFIADNGHGTHLSFPSSGPPIST
jgi:hypothetical protein